MFRFESRVTRPLISRACFPGRGGNFLDRLRTIFGVKTRSYPIKSLLHLVTYLCGLAWFFLSLLNRFFPQYIRPIRLVPLVPLFPWADPRLISKTIPRRLKLKNILARASIRLSGVSRLLAILNSKVSFSRRLAVPGHSFGARGAKFSLRPPTLGVWLKGSRI
jgi:hypothetical protein